MSPTPLLAGTPDRFRLDGSHAIVIGASRGIGRACALALAEIGADVTVASRTLDHLAPTAASVRTAGVRGRAVVLHVTDAAAVEAVFESADAESPLRIVVICAGVGAHDPIVDMDEGEYQRIVDTNLTGSWRCARAAGRRMLPRRAGKVVVVGSLTAYFGFNDASAYSASKSGVVHLARSLAVEWARDGIQVNVVAPGFVKSRMTEGSMADPNRRRWVLERTPAGRLAEPHEIGDAVAFIASPAADFITGQVLYGDGGFSAGSRW